VKSASARVSLQEPPHAAVWRGDKVVRAEPFDAIELDLAALWEA